MISAHDKVYYLGRWFSRSDNFSTYSEFKYIRIVLENDASMNDSKDF